MNLLSVIYKTEHIQRVNLNLNFIIDLFLQCHLYFDSSESFLACLKKKQNQVVRLTDSPSNVSRHKAGTFLIWYIIYVSKNLTIPENFIEFFLKNNLKILNYFSIFANVLKSNPLFQTTSHFKPLPKIFYVKSVPK